MRDIFIWGGGLLLLLFSACSSSKSDMPEAMPEEASTTSVLRLCPENPRYLEYQGQAILLISSAEHYGAVLNLDFDYKRYLASLREGGFNYTRIFTGTYVETVHNIFGIENNTLAPEEGRYLAPWLRKEGKYDLSRFNPDYFIRLKDFLLEAEKQGIMVEVTLFSSIYAPMFWERCPFYLLNNVNGVGDLPHRRVNTLYNGRLQEFQEAFVRRLVKELNAFDHIFYEVQNEPWADNPCLVAYVNEEDEQVHTRPWQKSVEVANGLSSDWQAWIVSLIRDEESGLGKKHLIAQNICNFQHQLEHLPEGVSILNFHYALPPAVQQNLDLGGVIGLDETGFMPQVDSLYIQQAWRIILSGAGLYNNLDYSYTTAYPAGDWPIAKGNPGWGGPLFREKLSYLVSAMKEIPFQSMECTADFFEGAQGLRQYGLHQGMDQALIFLEGHRGQELRNLHFKGLYELSFLDVDSGVRQVEIRELDENSRLSPPFGGKAFALGIKRTIKNP